jgi:hypothetical protein
VGCGWRRTSRDGMERGGDSQTSVANRRPLIPESQGVIVIESTIAWSAARSAAVLAG